MDSATALGALTFLVESLWRGGKAGDPETRKLAERNLAIMERIKGPEHTDVAGLLNGFGSLLALRGDYDDARKVLARALAIAEKGFGPDHLNVARVLQNVVGLYQLTGDFQAALPLVERGLAIKRKTLGPDHREVGLSLAGIAGIEFGMGSYAAAIGHYHDALAIREKTDGPDHPSVARAMDNLAMVLRANGDFAGARSYAESALVIREKSLGTKHPEYASSLDNLASIRKDMGDLAAARELNERALAIRRVVDGPLHQSVAGSLTNLATVLLQLGERDSARAMLELAIPTFEKSVGPEHPFLGMCLTNLATVRIAMGDVTGADSLLGRALAIQEKALGLEYPELTTTLNVLGVARKMAGRPEDARPLFERSVSIGRKGLGPDHPSVAESMGHLGQVKAALGDVEGALSDALEAEHIAREHLRLTTRSLSEREALRYSVVRNSGLDLALTLAGRGLDPASNRRVFDALIRSRAVVLDEMATRHHYASDPRDTTVTRLAHNLAAARERIANLMVRGLAGQTPQTYRKLLDQARDQKEQAERMLAGASARFAQEHARSQVGLDQVAANLPRGGALVAFVVYKRTNLSPPSKATYSDFPVGAGKEVPSYLAIVARPGADDVRAVDLGPVVALDGLISRWKQEVSGGGLDGGRAADASEARYRETGGTLRRAVWDPLANALDGVEMVFLVPDGALHLVNFSALPNPEGGYLIERGPLVHYLSAERDLVPGSDARLGVGLLALSMPDYDATSFFASLRKQAEPGRASPDRKRKKGVSPGASETPEPMELAYRGHRPTCADFSSLRFEPLPATEREAHEIVALWGKNRSKNGVDALDLSGAAASEAAFKRDAAGRRLLHLATHGFFLGGECRSGLASARGIGSLSTDEPLEIGEAPPPATGENPLLLSGLVLAGANHRSAAAESEEDGILTAEEIASLDLSGTEWAVLSACETGVGGILAGEGVFGLRRAFQVAGAGTLIMSLWSVDDEATRAWMKALYEARLRDHLDTASAVRRAGLTVLTQRRARQQSTHPFYWAAFVAAGDWR